MLIFNKDYRTPVIISLVLHLVLFFLLLGGSWFSGNEKKPQHKMVEAIVIDPKAIEQQAKIIKNQREAAKRAEQQRVEKLREEAEKLAAEHKKEQAELRKKQEQKVLAEKKAREEEKARKLAEKQKEEAIERARLEKEKAEKLAAEKKAAEAAAKAEAERKAEVAAKAKAEAAAKAKAEAARKAKFEKEKAAQEAALNDIFSGLEAETEQMSTAKQRYAASELDRYGAIYKQMIQDKLLTEDSFRGKSCKINIRLLQTGKDAIVSKVTSISGDNSLCSAAKRAVAQVASFPMPEDKNLANKLKDINLIVAPE